MSKASTKGALLIVNADDFGLTPAVSRAIIDAHNCGIVTSTSLLTLAPGFDKTAALLADAPSLGTGAHLAVVGEDPPLLSATEIPTLVDKGGALYRSWREFLPRAAAKRIDPEDLRREFGAQIQRIKEAGLKIDHFDTHQNLHLWPSVRRVVMELGELDDVRVIRVTRSSARSPVGMVVRRLARQLEAHCEHSGWSYTRASTGLDEAGNLDTERMIQALFRLAASGAPSAELATHPGEAGDGDLLRYQWDYHWADEYEALKSPAVRHAVDELGFQLGTFQELASADLTPGPSDPTPATKRDL